MANWATTAALGDPSTPEWQSQNLTWIEPVEGQRWQVYKPAAAAFEGLLKDLIGLGYKPTSSGGYNYRNIRGSDKLSQHAFGTAIDMNALTNALGMSVSDIPQAAELAKKHGLEWGGNWKNRPDPMHFEYTGALDAQMKAAGYTPEQRRAAIASIESAGSGDYKALGSVVNRQGDRAYGKYQVMASNIPAWTKQALGREMSPEEFLNDPAAQDKVFDTIFGGYVQKYGEGGAAQAWFGGPGNVGKADVKDMHGTTGGGYAERYLAALGAAPTGGSTSTTTAAADSPYKLPEKEKKTTKDKIGDMLEEMSNVDFTGGGFQPIPMPAQPAAAIAQAQTPPRQDPQAVELQRQKLAMVMQRLNQGSLV